MEGSEHIIIAIVGALAGIIGGVFAGFWQRRLWEAEALAKYQEILNAEIDARRKLEVEVRKLRRGVEKLISQIEKAGLCPDWRPEDNGDG